MSQFQHVSVQDVADKLVSAETSSDDTILAVADLTRSIVMARRRTNIEIGSIQAALADAGEAMQLAIQSRHRVCRSHATLLTVAKDSNLITGYGHLWPLCDNQKAQGEPAEIAKVA